MKNWGKSNNRGNTHLQSVIYATGWTKGLFEALERYSIIKLDHAIRRNDKDYYRKMIHETRTILQNSDVFVDELKIKLTKEIDKTTENPKIRQLLQNIKGDRRDFYSVDLYKIVTETLEKLGLSTEPAQYIDSISKVAPHYFSGFSILDEYSRIDELHLFAKYKEPFDFTMTQGKTLAFKKHPFEYCSQIYSEDDMRDTERFVDYANAENITKARRSGAADVSTITKQREIIQNRKSRDIRLKKHLFKNYLKAYHKETRRR